MKDTYKQNWMIRPTIWTGIFAILFAFGIIDKWSILSIISYAILMLVTCDLPKKIHV